MKRRFATVFTILLGAYSSFGQSCLPDGIWIDSQETLDSFINNYPDCNTILGNVIIEAPVKEVITNLNGFANIEAIEGNFIIGTNPQEGSFKNMEGLNQLKMIGGNLYISSNPSLQDLSGLDSLESVGNGLSFVANIGLKSLSGLEGLKFLGGDLTIESNNDLVDIYALNGIENMISLGTILFNESLAMCDATPICNFSQNVGMVPEINIALNTMGCNSAEEIKASCMVSDVNLRDDSSFISVYPNPTHGGIRFESNHTCVVNIYDLMGRLILRFTLNNAAEIDLTALNKGVYVFNIVGSSLNGKIIRQ